MPLSSYTYFKLDRVRTVGLWLGLFPLLLVILTDPAFSGLSPAAWYTAGLVSLMAIWWVTEALPIAVTALLPVLLSPLLGICSVKEATAPYAHPLIFLFLGGFILSLAMERWQLHRRIALWTMFFVGGHPARQIGGLMVITAFLSMWMSNTATAVMMLPIALSVIAMHQNSRSRSRYSVALLLGVAYSASIGGLATLIGTPPNALLAAYLSEHYGIEIGFGRWMALGVPVSLVMLFICWVWLCYPFLSGELQRENVMAGSELFKTELCKMGRMQRAERTIAVVFGLAALGWILRPWLANWSGWDLSDTSIAMAAGLSLFLLPSGNGSKVMEWRSLERLPWGVLILFGGGLSLAFQISHSGLAAYIAHSLEGMAALPVWLVMLVVTTLILFLTEITSNTATAAGFLPLLGPLAVAMGASPLMLCVPAALAASCAFMMPVATPPNSIVFSSGELKVSQMVRAGIVLNLAGIVVIFWIVQMLAAPLFG